MQQRSQMLLDIEHDLSLIKNRLNTLEDHFEDEGVIAELIEIAYRLAEKVAALEKARDARPE